MTERGGNIKMNRCSSRANLAAWRRHTIVPASLLAASSTSTDFWVLGGFWGARGELAYLKAYLVCVVEGVDAR